MKISRIGPVVACVFLAVATFGGAANVAGAGQHAATMLHATQVMNFFPQPELGGQYAAELFKTYHKYNLDVKLNSFNAKASNCEQLVVTGRVDFCMDDADQVLLARQQGIPVVAIMAIFQTNPIGWMWHAENKSMRTVADLSNNHLIYVFGAAYYDFLSRKYHYTKVKTQQYDFTLRAFLRDPKAVNQCYVSSEPYTARENGAKVKWALIAQSGYNPYSQMLLTSEKMIKEHPDVVRAYVQGSIDGWKSYFAQPEKVFDYLRVAPGATDYPLTRGAMRFGFAQIKPLVTAGGAATHGIGYIDPARMALLKKQMSGVGLKLDKVDVSKAFTDRFLPGQ